MNEFSKASKDRLDTCHPKLIVIFNEVLKIYDCSVLVGHRGEADQNKAFLEGKSDLKWPDGKHNRIPSLAVDVAPSPINWSKDHKNIARYYYFAGAVKTLALSKFGIKLRWGGDWDSDGDFKDQTFDDLVHFELVP